MYSKTIFILLKQVELKELQHTVEDFLRFVAIHSLKKSLVDFKQGGTVDIFAFYCRRNHTQTLFQRG